MAFLEGGVWLVVNGLHSVMVSDIVTLRGKDLPVQGMPKSLSEYCLDMTVDHI